MAVCVAVMDTVLRLAFKDVHSLYHALFIVGPIANLIEIWHDRARARARRLAASPRWHAGADRGSRRGWHPGSLAPHRAGRLAREGPHSHRSRRRLAEGGLETVAIGVGLDLHHPQIVAAGPALDDDALGDAVLAACARPRRSWPVNFPR